MTEEQLNEQIQLGVENLNSFLIDLPQWVPVDETSALNFSVVSEPVYDSTSISIGLRGEFVSLKKVESAGNGIVRKPPHASLTCSDDVKMVSIAISESVLNDGAGVYYSVRSMIFNLRVKGLSTWWYRILSCSFFVAQLDLLNWLVDTMPEKEFLNTSKWRYIIPQLYRDYPNAELTFHFDVTSPPTILLTPDGIEGSAVADMMIEAVKDGDLVPVACITIVSVLSKP
jgi:hypothetical protein